MSVGIKVGSIYDEIGSGSFLNCLFSTVTVLLERGVRGAAYPVFSKQFYAGSVPAVEAEKLLDELRHIRAAFQAYAPSQVVWDMGDRTARPPWGDNIAPTITSLANYFVSSTGRDVFDLLEEAVMDARDSHTDIHIASY